MELIETIIDIGALHPHPRNYNQHTMPQVERIAASLQQFGQVWPIVVYRDTIIARHGVYQAAQHLGYTSLRVTRLPDDWTDEQVMAYLVGYTSLRVTRLPDDWTDEQVMAYQVAYNETRRGAEPDGQELATLLDELSGEFDLAALGFSEDDCSALLDGLTPPGFAPVGVEEH